MADFVTLFFQPVKILVLLTFMIALFRLNRNNAIHRYLLAILSVCFATEVTNSILKSYGLTINAITTVSIMLHNSLWLLLLAKITHSEKVIHRLLIAFVVVTLVNLFYIEGVKSFNYYTFVISAFLYIVLFIYQSFYRLSKEEFSLFTTNNYLLLLSPLLFFFGLSFMFGFKSKELTSYYIFKDIKLYTVIIYLVNIVYYTLINIYIYREKRIRNV